MVMNKNEWVESGIRLLLVISGVLLLVYAKNHGII